MIMNRVADPIHRPKLFFFKKPCIFKNKYTFASVNQKQTTK